MTTPEPVLGVMETVGKVLAKKGLLCRSGVESPADGAFLRGALAGGGRYDVYLPWKGYNNSDSLYFEPSKKAFGIAERHHYRWDLLNDKTQKLMARNTHEVLGTTLDEPSLFILTWSFQGKEMGVAQQIVRVAKAYKIPVFNLGAPNVNLNVISGKIAKLIEEF